MFTDKCDISISLGQRIHWYQLDGFGWFPPRTWFMDFAQNDISIFKDILGMFLYVLKVCQLSSLRNLKYMCLHVFED